MIPVVVAGVAIVTAAGVGYGAWRRRQAAETRQRGADDQRRRQSERRKSERSEAATQREARAADRAAQERVAKSTARAIYVEIWGNIARLDRQLAGARRGDPVRKKLRRMRSDLMRQSEEIERRFGDVVGV